MSCGTSVDCAWTCPGCTKPEAGQKMWVRKCGRDWEVGCQCCGRIVAMDWSWYWAFGAALEHANSRHR